MSDSMTRHIKDTVDHLLHHEISAFDKVLKWMIAICLHGLVVLVPLLFCSWTTEAVELPKQTLLIIVSSVAFIAWLGRFALQKKLELRWHWMHALVLIYGLGYFVTSLASQNRYESLVGSSGQLAWSFATVLSLILLYFVSVHFIRSAKQLYQFLISFLIGSALALLFGILQLSGLFLFDGISEARAFTSVGGIFSLGVFSVMPVLLSLGLLWLSGQKLFASIGVKKGLLFIGKILSWAVFVLGLVLAFLIDFWVIWVLLLAGSISFLLLALWKKESGSILRFVLPVVAIILSLLFIFLDAPSSLSVPAEVTPSAQATWGIAKQALANRPIFGTGPGTWMQDYALYRNPLVNTSPFWNVRFERGFSYVSMLFASMGALGFILWLLLGVAIFGRVLSCFKKQSKTIQLLILPMAIAGAAGFVGMALYTITISSLFALWFLIGLLMSTQEDVLIERKLTLKSSLYYGVVSVLTLAVLFGVSISWLAGQRYAAEGLFKNSVEVFQSTGDADVAIRDLERITRLNPYVSRYTRNVSQAHLVQLAAELSKDEPSSFTLRNELEAATNAAIKAAEQDPNNVINWSNRAVVYASIASRVPGADEEAIRSLESAHDLEPANPVFLTELGKLHLLRADAFQTKLTNEDKSDDEEGQEQLDASLELALGYLARSIELKADYLPARYHLGITQERLGALPKAIAELERVLSINAKDVGVAFELSILYYRNNQKQQALSLLEQIVQKFQPDNVNARWYLAAMYAEFERYDESIQELETLSDLDPDFLNPLFHSIAN